MNICTLESNNQKRYGLKAAGTRGSLGQLISSQILTDGPNDGPLQRVEFLTGKKWVIQ